MMAPITVLSLRIGVIIVLRTVCDRPTLWDQLLPEEARVMPAELLAVDGLLDDPRFFEPFRCSTRCGVDRRFRSIPTSG